MVYGDGFMDKAMLLFLWDESMGNLRLRNCVDVSYLVVGWWRVCRSKLTYETYV